MKIGYAAKIGFRTFLGTADTLHRITRAGGQVRLGKKGPTVTQAAAAGIIAGQLKKMFQDKPDVKKPGVKKSDKNNAEVYADQAGGEGKGRKRNPAFSAIRSGVRIRKAGNTAEKLYSLVKYGRKFL